jgi:hypothetical protein
MSVMSPSCRARNVGIRTAVGSSSKNAQTILHAAGLDHHVNLCIDGLDAGALGCRASRIRRCFSKPYAPRRSAVAHILLDHAMACVVDDKLCHNNHHS